MIKKDKIEFITELALDNGIELSGIGATEEASIQNALSLFPYTTNKASYTVKDMASMETYRLPQHYTAEELAQMYKTTINYNDAESSQESPLVSIHHDEAKSLDIALDVLKHYDIAVTNIESIETKEII